MTTTTRITPACLRFPVATGVRGLVFFLVATSSTLLAQPNPFGGGDPDNPPPAPQSNLLSDQPEKETNPAVLSILESKPQTIPEMTRAAKQLVDLDRPALAVILLEKIAAGQANLADVDPAVAYQHNTGRVDLEIVAAAGGNGEIYAPHPAIHLTQNICGTRTDVR